MSKQTASKSPVSGRPIWIYPDGSNSSDSEPFAADATSNNSLDADSQPKSEIPQMAKEGNEYRDNRDSKDCGKRLGSLASKSDKRVELSSVETRTPDFFSPEANESIN